ncbi:E3 ubiquitin ligase SCF complex, Skp subunit [Schizopora paradoxa]|uniref:E3 ubiquitin ligase complex SCF subunit n=1 Tax=Schizopora paradoxa TaxID=27342 RepID=A0A0H2RHZ2_9AGAM|nr:E3 ubiquitin ligase SCF complex, Skp subunit [Schizopora paradoxa]
MMNVEQSGDRDDADMLLLIKLLPSDGIEPLLVEWEIAARMRILKNMIEDVGFLDEAIPLPNVQGYVLKIILDYCEMHRTDDDSELIIETLEMDERDREFIERHVKHIYRIMLAADYLEVQSLIDLASKFIANRIRGKTPKQNREFFRIESDFNAEEARQIMKENGWTEAEF